MVTKKKTKRKVKRYVPSIVIINGKSTFIYKYDVQPMTKKNVEAFDKALQEMLASGKMTTSLAYVEI